MRSRARSAATAFAAVLALSAFSGCAFPPGYDGPLTPYGGEGIGMGVFDAARTDAWYAGVLSVCLDRPGSAEITSITPRSDNGLDVLWVGVAPPTTQPVNLEPAPFDTSAYAALPATVETQCDADFSAAPILVEVKTPDRYGRIDGIDLDYTFNGRSYTTTWHTYHVALCTDPDTPNEDPIDC